MAHIAIIIMGLRGKLNASLEIARKLIKEGHEITYICPLDISAELQNHGHRLIKVPAVN